MPNRYPRGTYTIIGNHVLERVIRSASAEAALELALEARRFYRRPGLSKSQLQVLTGRGETAVRTALRRLITLGRINREGDLYYAAPIPAQHLAAELPQKPVQRGNRPAGNTFEKLNRPSPLVAALEAAWMEGSDAP